MRLLLIAFACASCITCGPPGPSSEGRGGGGGGGNPAPDAGTPGANVPDRPVATGTCPSFTAGTNTLNPTGQNRQIDLYLPDATANAPVLFIWHGLGDTADNMARAFGAQNIANQTGAIVVVPHVSGQFHTAWGFVGDSSLDAALFEEALSCLDAHYGIDRGRVYTTGFSAGALWSTWLVMNRSQYLAAAALFSGGVPGPPMGGTYTSPDFDLPVLALHGGTSDIYGGGVIRFNEATIGFADGLKADGHFVVVCNHDRGHTIPFNVMDFALPFLFDHRFGSADSPHSEGLPQDWPSFCAIH